MKWFLSGSSEVFTKKKELFMNINFMNIKMLNVLSLLSGVAIFMVMSASAMEADKSLQLLSTQRLDSGWKEGGIVVPITLKAARLSKTLEGLLESVVGASGKPIPIPTGNIDSATLKFVVELMEHVALGNTTQQLTAQIEKKLGNIFTKLLQTISYGDLFKAIEYLGIEDILREPWTLALIQSLQKKGTDKNSVEKALSNLDLELSGKAIVAKYWFLNYGVLNNEGRPVFILPDLDYGFSFAELLKYNILPKVEQSGHGWELDCEGYRINDFAGFQKIRKVSDVTDLRLANNKLTVLQPGVLNGLTGLKMLYLANNKLTALQPGVFNGLTSLEVLDLSKNKLAALQPGVFAELKGLLMLNLSHNNLATLEPGVFAGLKEVTWLDLSYNKLTALEPEVFRDFQLDLLYPDRGLYEVYLSGNPLDPSQIKRLEDALPRYQARTEKPGKHGQHIQYLYTGPAMSIIHF